MSLRLDGINPLAYLGVKPSQPPNLLVRQIDPTANDFQNINVGTFWLVYPDQRLWFLISVVGGTATWVQIYPAGGGGGGGADQFVTDAGIANQLASVINIIGDGNITTSGAGNTVTIHLANDIPENFETDSGTAHPSSNTLRILGGTNINTSGASNNVTVNLDNSVSLSGTLDVTGASGFTGTATFNGDVIISSEVDGVLLTNGSGLISAANGTDGQLLIGGGTSPQWANLTSSGGTIIITDGANSINLEATGGGGGEAGTVSFFAYQAADQNVPVTGNLLIDPTYEIGTLSALTVTLNDGSAFYPGDGAGIPASFTAPSDGIYYFSSNLCINRGFIGTSSSNVFFQISHSVILVNGVAICSASGNRYAAVSAPISTEKVELHNDLTYELSAGDVVTFTVSINASLTAPIDPTNYAFRVLGPEIWQRNGPLTAPVSWISGHILRTIP